jgi:hypothetical protein
MAVLGTPSSSASSRIFLSATIWFVLTSLALYTTPYVPVVAHEQRARERRGFFFSTQKRLDAQRTFACIMTR